MTSSSKILGAVLSRRDAGGMLEALGPFLARGLRVYCLDGGNLFDPLPLALWLRARNQDPRQILGEQVFLSRAFTCYQLAGASEALIAPLAGRERTLAVVLGVEEMFLDEDIRLKERRYWFERILSRLEGFSRAGLPLLVTCGQHGFDALGKPRSLLQENPWIGALARRMPLLGDLGKTLPALRRIADGTNLADL